MNGRRRSEAGLTLAELLVALAAGSLVLLVAAGLQQQLTAVWHSSTARQTADRGARTALQEISRLVQASRSLTVSDDGQRLEMAFPDGTNATVTLSGQSLVLQEGPDDAVLANHVALFAVAPVRGGGVSLHLTVTAGNETIELQTHAYPWQAQ